MDSQSLRGLLIDLDGVLYVGGEMIPGARETLAAIEEQGLARRFVTNTTTRTAREVVAKLDSMGFTVRVEEVFSAVTATVSFLRSQKGGRPGVSLIVSDSVRGEFAEFPEDDDEPDFVIVGDIGAAWSYPLMNRAFRQMNTGAELVAMHKNKFFETEEGLALDIGAFVEGLEYVTKKSARIIGKPSRDFFQQGITALDLPAGEVAMVGDDIDSDVGGGQAAGLCGILVKTGKYRADHAGESGVVPDLVLDSIADLPEQLF